MRVQNMDTEELKRRKKELEEILFKAIGGARNLPINESYKWDANAAIVRMRRLAGGPNKEDIDWEKYKRGFVWYDPQDKENFRAYKLPFADVLNGRLTAIWGGVARAMATLFGARGGVDIPDKDRKATYNFLRTYYERFDKEPPEFREYTEEELKELFPEIYKNEEDELLSAIYDLKEEIALLKEGRVLSEKNRKLIQSTIQQMREAISALEELLKATEPKQDIVDLDKIDVRDFYDEDNKDKDIEIDEEEIAKVIKEELKELFKIAKPEPVDYKKLAQEMIDKAKGKVK